MFSVAGSNSKGVFIRELDDCFHSEGIAPKFPLVAEEIVLSD